MLYNHPKCAELLREVGALSKETIYDFAATCIQAAFRGHRWESPLTIGCLLCTVLGLLCCPCRARCLYRRELQRHKAVTTIAAHWRGCVQRRRYLVAVQRQQAAIKVQSVFRFVVAAAVLTYKVASVWGYRVYD